MVLHFKYVGENLYFSDFSSTVLFMLEQIDLRMRFYKIRQHSATFGKILHESTRFCNILSANRNDNEYQIREAKSCYQSFRELHLAANICKIDRNYKKLCLGILSDVKVDMTDTTRHDTTRHDTTITGLRDDEQQLRYSSSKNW